MSRFGLGFIRSDIGRFDLFRIYRCWYNQCHQDAVEIIIVWFILKNQKKKKMNKLKISTKLSNKENKAQFIAPYNCVLFSMYCKTLNLFHSNSEISVRMIIIFERLRGYSEWNPIYCALRFVQDSWPPQYFKTVHVLLSRFDLNSILIVQKFIWMKLG